MKKLIFIMSFLLFAASCSDKDDFPTMRNAGDFDGYFWNNGAKTMLQKMDNKFYVLFYAADENRLRDEFAEAGITVSYMRTTADFALWSEAGREGPGAKKFTNIMMALIEGSYKEAAPILSTTIYWSPSYTYMDNGQVWEIRPTEMIFATLKPRTTLAQLARLAKANSVELIGWKDTMGGFLPDNVYILACTNKSKGNALQMTNLFYASGLFEQVHYDQILDLFY